MKLLVLIVHFSKIVQKAPLHPFRVPLVTVFMVSDIKILKWVNVLSCLQMSDARRKGKSERKKGLCTFSITLVE